MTPETIIAATFVVYILGMLGIGAWAYRRTTNLSDYILGGRTLGSFVTALSAGASDMSGWLLLGLPGYAYVAGLEAGWIALGLAVGTYLNWKIVASRLREKTEQAGNALTLPEFLEARFQDRTRLLRLTSALFILVFFTFYTASGLVAGAKLFDAVFGLPYHWALVIGASVIIGYTCMGGFLAVCWTDCVQALLMALALVLVPIIAVNSAGGWGAAVAGVRALNSDLLSPITTAEGSALSLVAIVSLMAWGLGYFGQPHILARFMAIRSPSGIPRARRIAMTWVLLGMVGALAAGFAGIVTVEPVLAGADREKVFILLVRSLLHPIPAGICLAAILAAIMSTADSQLLVSASVLSGDVYKDLFRRKASPRELMWMGRLAVVVVAAVATSVALDPESMVLEIVEYAWAGFGAAFGPTIILSLTWKRMTRNGALAGILVGGLTVIVWELQAERGGIFELYEIVPGFLLSLAAIVGVSLLGRRPAAAGGE